MSESYWNHVLRQRLSRRRAMVTTGAGALGAAFLAACGSDSGDDSGSAKKDKSGLITTLVDTTKQAVKGGTLGYFLNADPPTLDPNFGGAAATRTHNEPAYQRLLKWSVGTRDKRPSTVEGDAAQSYEVSPDGLQITFKLRPGNKWDPRPPTNGRAITTDDLKQSWEMLEKGTGAAAGAMANSRNPAAPVKSVEFPDSSTAVFKLASVNSAIVTMFTYCWYLSLLPVEAFAGGANSYDRKVDMRGSGPYMLTKAQGSIGYEYQRNPNYWNKERPFFDGFTWPIIPESAQVLAQLKAGRIWYYTPSADLVLQTKKDVPQLQMQALSPFAGNLGGANLNPSKLPNSPFQDVRTRYAMSMLIDRDTYNDTFGNIPAMEAQGIAMESGWDGFIPMSWPNDWLDPKAGKLGEYSKYWKFDPAEASKLLTAAGTKGLEFTYSYIGSGGISTDIYRKQNEVLVEMISKDGLLKPKPNRVPSAEYLPNYTFAHGQYEGVAYVPVGGLPDIDMHIFAIYEPGGRNDYVFKAVPGAHELALKHQAELDSKKAQAISKEWQVAMAKEMPTIIAQGNNEWTQFTLNWPKLQNYGALVLQSSDGTNTTLYENWWYDKTKDTA
ncbi:MAG TPA: ABC transporter substrate-binding protein [Dehalococcoidia bacterium]|nr:ABC transporter substrate-binding protein [Dehalococcoidia bacterium]